MSEATVKMKISSYGPDDEGNIVRTRGGYMKVHNAKHIECTQCGFVGWVERLSWLPTRIGETTHLQCAACCNIGLTKLELADGFWFDNGVDELELNHTLVFPSTGHAFSVVQVTDDFCTAWASLVSFGGVTIVGH